MVMKDTGKKLPKDKNGRVEEMLTQQGELLNQIVQKLQDHDMQFSELEKGQDNAGKAQLMVAERVFNTDREHLLEMSNIPSMQPIRAFALSIVCSSVLNKKVLSGEVSLSDVHLDAILRGFRGFKGKLQELAAQQAMKEQEGKAETGQFEAAEYKGL